MIDLYTCELCRRVGVTKITEHHLTPREEGGKNKPTAWLCESCHKQIHALYSNKELAIRLNTLIDLDMDEKIQKYVKYIKKQPASKSVSVKKSREIKKM